jgi:hypothetical protein
MKFLLIGLLSLCTLTAQAELRGTPFTPDVDQRFDVIEALNRDGVDRAKRVARVTYDASVTGGFGICTGKFLPANALITDSYGFINTAFTAGATANLAVTCEDGGNILAATEMSTYTTGLIQGLQRGSFPNMKAEIANRCELKFEQTADIFTAGKLTMFIEYVIHD